MAGIVSKASNLFKLGVEGAMPKLGTFLSYAKVELVPPTPGELVAGIGGLAKLGKSAATLSFMRLTVKEAWVNTLVATEVVCWFFVGECIGKGSIIGYQV
ncbi:ATP synthase F0 complex subunit G mitochondrial [Trinorchestia longiramus]|nr:ATP synthase F0 complex subunit G mitochondrial [Trinorchestia longiramus]KAF2350040.1 ATP synthase F0 complex subunit G mitochondrial [Trinorchestia longiramus]